jgi:hypothetical protein
MLKVQYLRMTDARKIDPEITVAPKAPSLYHCPCCGTTFVHRQKQECPACAIPLHLKGEYMVTPYYLYMDSQREDELAAGGAPVIVSGWIAGNAEAITDNTWRWNAGSVCRQ